MAGWGSRGTISKPSGPAAWSDSREVRVRFGLLITNQHLPSEPPLERFAETIEEVRLAREL